MKYQILTFIICISIFVKPHYINAQKKEQKGYNILFVGNSLTYSNNLPKLTARFAKQKEIKVNTDILAKPNYAIVDHLADGKVQKMIENNRYDFVILQQGPSSQKEGFEMLVEGGKVYKELCESNGSKLVFFMVWPALQYYDTFDGVIANYTKAALLNNAILCPVGKIWKDYFDKSEDFSFYSEDGFHPSKKGSEKAAKIIADTLFGLE